MAWLAWLMLAVAPVHAAPGGMMGMAPAADHAAQQAQASDHAHHTKAECCDGQDHAGHGTTNACHCAATCGTALPVMAMAALSPVALVAVPVPLGLVVAPKLMHAPLLRPPLVVSPS
jgi:hypothetical protein